jgi:hypothetical protein
MYDWEAKAARIWADQIEEQEVAVLYVRMSGIRDRIPEERAEEYWVYDARVRALEERMDGYPEEARLRALGDLNDERPSSGDR